MRIFTDVQRGQLARKPSSLVGLPGVTATDAEVRDLSDYALYFDHGTLTGLDRAIRELRESETADAKTIEFLAVAPDGAIYAVNTEGFGYARYVGLLRAAPGLPRGQ